LRRSGCRSTSKESGDDVFDRILQLYETYDLPGCVARLTEAVPDLKAEVVGYAVACIGEDGSKT
jgi:spore coat polysaccharide biosynthesis protein SpsF (cytidylyltransferase family)